MSDGNIAPVPLSTLVAVFSYEPNRLEELLANNMCVSETFGFTYVLDIDLIGYITVAGSWLLGLSLAMGVAPKLIGAHKKGFVYMMTENIFYVSDEGKGMVWTSEDAFQDGEIEEFIEFINEQYS